MALYRMKSYISESHQSVVGTVTSLKVQEARGEVVRITWVGVQGATSYRVSWRNTNGDSSSILISKICKE